ncbi:MAG: DUF1499 domain-containing protein [Hyphomicrobiaceae bacterium]
MQAVGTGDDASAIQSSIWTIRIALFCLALMILTIIFHRIFGMGTKLALNLFTLCFAGCVLVLLTGLFALLRIWQRGWRGGPNVVTGMVIAVIILAWPVGVIATFGSLPAINDVTTDPANPPQLIAIAGKRPRGANPTEYPGKDFADLQTEAYGKLSPIIVRRPASETLDLVQQALQRKRMQVLGRTAVDSLGGGWGQIDAVDRTLVLGFYDDVVVRVTRVGEGSLVDVRSASRFGVSDFGRNAARVREVLAEVAARVEATVPASRARRQRQSRRQ